MCIWNSVDVHLNPELREKILSGELFTYHCPSCGEDVGIPAGLVYNDMTHKFMLLFDFFKPDDYDYPPPAVLIPIENDVTGYTFRRVFDFNCFREKILILEQGLNDIAIERMKYMIRTILSPDVVKNGYEICFDMIEEPTEANAEPKISFLIFDNEGNLTMRSRTTMNKYYQYCLSCKLDPRMNAERFCCVDEGWISKQLKEEWK